MICGPCKCTCDIEAFSKNFSFAIVACDRTTETRIKWIILSPNCTRGFVDICPCWRTTACNSHAEHSFTPNIQNRDILPSKWHLCESTRRTPTTWFSIKIYRTQLKVRASPVGCHTRRFDATHTQTRTRNDACVRARVQMANQMANYMYYVVHTSASKYVCDIVHFECTYWAFNPSFHISFALDK